MNFKAFIIFLLGLTLTFLPAISFAQNVNANSVKSNSYKIKGASGNRCLKTDANGVVTEFECWVSPPSSPNNTCTAGQQAYDSGYYYVCVGTNSWQRVALSPEWGTVTINVKNYGALGDDTNDDTAEINAAIAALQPGYTLYFPCGTYKTSSTLTITTDQVTVSGASGCATIHATGSGYVALILGDNSSYLSSSANLTSNANEGTNTLAFTLSTVGGVAVNDLLVIEQGGRDYSDDGSTGDHNGGGAVANDMGCDLSGCRGEVVQVQSVGASSVTITTSLHDNYNVATNGAHVRKVLDPTEQLNVHDLTINGSGTISMGLGAYGVLNSTISNINVTGTVNSGLTSWNSFNLAWSNLDIQQAGNGSSDAMVLANQGRPSINTAYFHNMHGDSFGLGLHTVADGTFTGVTVDATAQTASARPVKLSAARWSTFNNLVARNNGISGTGGNGIDIEYYSSHNTFNSCSSTTIKGHGIATFGNYNQYNKFVNCTVSNPTVNAFAQTASSLGQYNDTYLEISGGTYSGYSGQNVMQINSTGLYVHSATISGPGNIGLALTNPYDSSVCINDNIFTGTLTAGADIYANSVTGYFNRNTTPHGTTPSSLATGTCP